MMTYKGYTASLSLDPDAGILTGTVAGIRDVIHFEARDAEGLRLAFEESVNDYLSYCQNLGREPEKYPSGKFNLRLGKDLHRTAVAAASARGMTLNGWIADIVERAAKKEEENLAKITQR